MKKFVLVFLCLEMMFSVAFASEQKQEAADKWEISMTLGEKNNGKGNN